MPAKPNTPLDVGGSTNYRGYDIESRFDYDPGYLVLPVGDTTGGYVKLRLHGGIERRRVMFSAVKTDTPPLLPRGTNVSGVLADGYTVGTTYEFLGSRVGFPMPVPTPEGIGYDWKATGEYEYVATQPHAPDGVRGYPLATPPFPTTSEQVPLAFGGLAGGAALASFQTYPNTDPDQLSPIDFTSVYSYPYCQKINYSFFQDGLVK